MGDRQHPLKEAKEGVGFGVNGVARGKEDLQAGENEKNSQKQIDPVDLQEDGAEGDEDDAEENGSKNAPKEDLVLRLGGDAKEAEQHDEDEEVVDRQGLFDDETGEEFQGGVTGLAIRIKTG